MEKEDNQMIDRKMQQPLNCEQLWLKVRLKINLHFKVSRHLHGKTQR